MFRTYFSKIFIYFDNEFIKPSQTSRSEVFSVVSLFTEMAAVADDVEETDGLENAFQDLLDMEIDRPDKRETCDKCRYKYTEVSNQSSENKILNYPSSLLSLTQTTQVEDELLQLISDKLIFIQASKMWFPNRENCVFQTALTRQKECQK